MIYLFARTEDLPDSFIDCCAGFLPEWRTEQMMRYRFSSDRKLCAVAYLLLVYGLKKEGLFTALPQFSYGDSADAGTASGSKPALSNYPDIFFNLSHCKGAAVCAISNKPVGIDIERVEAYEESLAKQICNAPQYDWVNELPAENAYRLTEIWAKKESVVKCTGVGLEEDLHAISMEGCQVTRWQEGNNQYIISVK